MESTMLKRNSLTKQEVEARLEQLFDRVWREFRPVESAYWKGNFDRSQFLQRTFEICTRLQDALIKEGLAPEESKDENPVWACACRVVAITYSELPKLVNPEEGYHAGDGEYRIVKTKKCPQQKGLVRELAALLMYNYGELS